MASSKAVELTRPRRARRSVTYTDAIFRQLMEAHNNSTYSKAAAATTAAGKKKRGGCADMLTVENFGVRTGLHWSEERVVGEIAGLISGFTRQQEEKLTVLRKSGRAVVETISSMMEFDGTGDHIKFPFRSRQQIAAKLLDMFGDGNAKADVQVKPDKKRAGPKMYIYHDGTGKATLQPAATSTTDNSTTGSTDSSRGVAVSAFQGQNKNDVKPPPTTATTATTTARAPEPTAGKGNVSSAPVTFAATDSPRSSRFDARQTHSSSSVLSEEDRACLAASSAVGLALESHNGTYMLRPSTNSLFLGCDAAEPIAEATPRSGGGVQKSSGFCSFDTVHGESRADATSTNSRFSSCGGTAATTAEATSTSSVFPSCETNIATPTAEGGPKGPVFFSFDTAETTAERTPKDSECCSFDTTAPRSVGMAKGPEFCSFEIEGPVSLTGVPVRPAWASSCSEDGRDSTFSTPAWLTSTVVETPAAVTETGNASSNFAMVPDFPVSVSLEERESLGLAFGSSLTAEDWLLGTSLMLDVGSIF